MHCKFEGNEDAFGAIYGLGATTGEYAIHGGGFPIKVKGVEGVVAVVVVTGLKQEEDHGVIVEVIRELYHGQAVSVPIVLRVNASHSIISDLTRTYELGSMN